MPTKTQREPVVMVIFGAGGDLAWRKLVPAIYNLFLDNRLPDRFAIVGMARKEMTDEDFRGRLREGIDLFSRSGRVDEPTWREFASRLSYCAGDFTAPGSGELLGQRLEESPRTNTIGTYPHLKPAQDLAFDQREVRHKRQSGYDYQQHLHQQQHH